MSPIVLVTLVLFLKEKGQWPSLSFFVSDHNPGLVASLEQADGHEVEDEDLRVFLQEQTLH